MIDPKKHPRLSLSNQDFFLGVSEMTGIYYFDLIDQLFGNSDQVISSPTVMINMIPKLAELLEVPVDTVYKAVSLVYNYNRWYSKRLKRVNMELLLDVAAHTDVYSMRFNEIDWPDFGVPYEDKSPFTLFDRLGHIKTFDVRVANKEGSIANIELRCSGRGGAMSDILLYLYKQTGNTILTWSPIVDRVYGHSVYDSHIDVHEEGQNGSINWYFPFLSFFTDTGYNVSGEINPRIIDLFNKEWSKVLD